VLRKRLELFWGKNGFLVKRLETALLKSKELGPSAGTSREKRPNEKKFRVPEQAGSG